MDALNEANKPGGLDYLEELKKVEQQAMERLEEAKESISEAKEVTSEIKEDPE
jgi:hypothetical protein